MKKIGKYIDENRFKHLLIIMRGHLENNKNPDLLLGVDLFDFIDECCKKAYHDGISDRQYGKSNDKVIIDSFRDEVEQNPNKLILHSGFYQIELLKGDLEYWLKKERE